MRPIRIPPLNPERLDALEKLYRTTREARLRTRAQMVLLAAERRPTAAEIAEIVRVSKETVRRWFKGYLAEGVEGLRDVPHPGAPRKVTEEYRELLVEAVRHRPRGLGLPFSLWTLRRLADYMAERTGIRVGEASPPPSNLWCGDEEAWQIVEQLNRDAGYEPVYAGPLENAGVQENFLKLVFGISQGGLGRFFYRMAPPDRL